MADSDQSNNHSESALNELKIINNLLNKICQVRETNHIMELIIADLIRATNADKGIINLVEQTRGGELLTVVRNEEIAGGGLPFKVSSFISGWVLKNRRALRIDDLDADERFSGLTSNGGKLKSVICCPMVVRNEIIGLTCLVRSSNRGPFTDEDCRLVGILASQSGQILSNAKLLEELAQKNELLELTQSKLSEENIRLKGEVGSTFSFENIIGKSQAIKNVLALVSRLSTNDSPVLIAGDTGTGKELIARAIHYNSNRKDKPFVIKNCGVKTEALLESELFGHLKGSFTGAIKDKIGLFKEADGGTIFLDEIGDAPMSTQAAILRVIQNGEIRPIGANKAEYVDVRVLSATNKNLADEMKMANFREDLFYRLNTFTVDLPPLSQRKEDIPLLVNHFLRKLRIKLANDNLSISSGAMDILMKYDWPGNIRQLENIIERAAVVCNLAGIIEANNLGPEIIVSTNQVNHVKNNRGPLKEMVENLERDIIKAALEENNGNILQVSKILGLTRKGLKNKIVRYKIAPGDE